MDIVFFLSSFNKISLIAFFVTLGFIFYEINQIKKETVKKSQPVIPDFKENFSPKTNTPKVIVVEENKRFIKPSKTPLIIGFFLLIIFGLISVLGFALPEKMKSSQKAQQQPIVSFVTSKGIKIFDLNWNELTDEELVKLKGGQRIIIGVDTIKDLDIDRARIKVNDNEWQVDHITLDFKADKNVYYKEYEIGSDESSLKIEAQLHSKTDGWLGE